jgi:hypothetical protein
MSARKTARKTARNTARLAPRDIALRRLANQRLIGAPYATPVEAVRRLGAVQSQDYAGAKWAVGQRTADAADADIERALTDGAIVRTHVLRPTWHFVAAEDIRWMLALTAPRVRARMAPYNRQLGLDEKVFARSNAIIAEMLAGGKHLTRTELGVALQRTGINTGQRLAHLMMHAELDALVCSGAHRGKEPTYALLEERVAPARAMERDEALAELATRYFTTHGPATAQDFAWWSGLLIGDARRGIESVESVFEREVIEGRTFWFIGSVPASSRAAPVAHLLPNYDEFFIGHKDRSALGERVAESKIVVPAEAFIAHVVAVDGQLVGGWKRRGTARKAIVELRLVVDLTARERRAVEAQVERYGRFLGMPVEIVDAS